MASAIIGFFHIGLATPYAIYCNPGIAPQAAGRDWEVVADWRIADGVDTTATHILFAMYEVMGDSGEWRLKEGCAIPGFNPDPDAGPGPKRVPAWRFLGALKNSLERTPLVVASSTIFQTGRWWSVYVLAPLGWHGEFPEMDITGMSVSPPWTPMLPEGWFNPENPLHGVAGAIRAAVVANGRDNELRLWTDAWLRGNRPGEYRKLLEHAHAIASHSRGREWRNDVALCAFEAASELEACPDSALCKSKRALEVLYMNHPQHIQPAEIMEWATKHLVGR